jgi:hypothetical protein
VTIFPNTLPFITSIRQSLSLCALATLVCLAMAPTVSAAGLDHAGRWFTYDDQPTYLVGMDAQELACNPAVDYVAALNKMQEYRINKVRIWAYCYWDTATYFHPWVFKDGKFDLSQWNTAYWKRMNDFVEKARDRKIMVEVCIFAAYPNWTNGFWKRNLAWKKEMNVNGVYSANSSGDFYPQFFDLDYAENGKKFSDYQQALVDKTLAELGDSDNVYFEIMNEFGADGTDMKKYAPWVLHWANRIKTVQFPPPLQDVTLQRMVSAHAGGTSAGNDGTTATFRPEDYWSQTDVDVMNFRSFSPKNSPQGVSNWLHTSQLKGKVLCVNESNFGLQDYVNDPDGQTRYSWGLLLNGAHMGIYVDKSTTIGDAAWLVIAKRLKAIRDVVDKVRFSEMSPVDALGVQYDGLVTQGPSGSNRQVLANPGSQYLAYFWGSQSTANTLIKLPAGTYAYAWYDARDAALRRSGTVTTGGGTASIPAPGISGWKASVGLALVVTRTNNTNTPPTVSLTGPANGSVFTVPANVTVSANASDSDGTVSKVDFYQGTTLIGTDTTSPYSIAWNSVAAGSYSLTARATDNAGAVTTSSAVSITVTGAQSPFNGTAWAIPGNVAVVQYDNGGEGVAYHDTEAANLWLKTFRPGEGVDCNGVEIGWLSTGEWLEYTVNVAQTGSYTLTIPLSGTGTGGKIRISMNGVDVTGPLTAPTTGGWHTFQDVSTTVSLVAGKQVMRISVDSKSTTGGATNLKGNVVFSKVPSGNG